MKNEDLETQSIIYPSIRERLLQQGYQLYGKQIAVKKCLWTHHYLKDNRYCYKNAYGIESHRCIQATPTLLCNHQCLFCWRLQEKDIGLEPFWDVDDIAFDSPEEVYKGLLWGWKRCISGYKPATSELKFREAMNPKHIALSLAGEPTLYPHLLELITLLRKKGLSTFLVSNGTNPSSFQKMLETNIAPDQLYITIPTTDEQEYLKFCKPLISNGWERINQSLEIMSLMKNRTVTRLTLAKSINMFKPEAYVPLIEKAMPSFIEIKGFVPVGFSQYRVTRKNMPFIEDIELFAQKILEELPEYKQVFHSEESKVVILSNNKHPLKLNLNK